MGDIKSNMSKLIYESRGDRDLHCTESQSEASTEEGHDSLSVGSFEEDSKSEFILDPPKPKPPAWFNGILTWEDFELVNPHRARFLKEIKDLAPGHWFSLRWKRLYKVCETVGYLVRQ